MLNPELYSWQFEDSACVLINVSYSPPFLRELGSKNSLFKIYSNICSQFSSLTHDDSHNVCFAYSLTFNENNNVSPTSGGGSTRSDALTEIQSFRKCYATIFLELCSDEDIAQMQSSPESNSDSDTDADVDDSSSKVSADAMVIKVLKENVLEIEKQSTRDSGVENGSGDCQLKTVGVPSPNESPQSSRASQITPSSFPVYCLETNTLTNKNVVTNWLHSLLRNLLDRKSKLENIIQQTSVASTSPQSGAESIISPLKEIIPLTMEKEEKQQLGVTVHFMREKMRGRCLKLLADLLLQLDKCKEATDCFKKSSECLMTAKDWLWYAASLEGLITSTYLPMLPKERQNTFSERVFAHQTELLCSEDQLQLSDQMRQVLDYEKTVLNHYDKSVDTKFMLREFKYKVLLVKYSFGIFKSKHDGTIVDENFTLFPDLKKDKGSPNKMQQNAAHAHSNVVAEVRKCLAAVKLLVFKEQTRKAAFVLNELVGGDVSLDYFHQNPLSAVIYLVHVLPIYGVTVSEAFVHRGGMLRGRHLWRELQLHIIDLILYYLELLQRNNNSSNSYSQNASSDAVKNEALSVTTWFKCFKLNTYYHFITASDIDDVIIPIQESTSMKPPTCEIGLNGILKFPPVVFTNLPFLRSITVSHPFQYQLHLNPNATAQSASNKLFEYQSSILSNSFDKNRNKQQPYKWPASSSFIVQLVFVNSLRNADNMTLDVELVTSGVDVEVDVKRNVRISPLTVESVNFEVGYKEPGEIVIEGYRIRWVELDFTSTVMFTKNSKFITKHEFGEPYLECFRFPGARDAVSSTDESEASKEFITKDAILKETILFGAKRTFFVFIEALKDIEKIQVCSRTF